MDRLSASPVALATDPSMPSSVSPVGPRSPAAARSLRVAMFASNYPPHPGGLEVMVQQLSRGLARRHHVTVVTSAHGAATGISREDGLVVHRLPTLHATESLGVPYPTPLGPGIREAMRAVRDADLVHAHGALYPHTMLAARAARRAGAPLVVTEHVGFVDYANPVVNGVQRAAWSLIGDRTIRRADAITVCSQRVEAWLERRFRLDVHFIGNGVDLATFRVGDTDTRARARAAFGLPPDRPLVLFAARASEKKRIEDVLRIPREGFTLVVCGAQRKLAGRDIVDLGIVPHSRMAELYSAVDIAVQAGVGEGFPLAVLEAMAAGVPLVLRWDDGYAGMLDRQAVRACDSPDEIRTAVLELLGSPADREKLSVRARAWVSQHWSWDVTVNAFEELYDVVRSGFVARG